MFQWCAYYHQLTQPVTPQAAGSDQPTDSRESGRGKRGADHRDDRTWMRSLAAMLGASGANDFPRQADGSGQAVGDHASSRTGPDDAERPDRVLTPKRPLVQSQYRPSAREPPLRKHRIRGGPHFGFVRCTCDLDRRRATGTQSRSNSLPSISRITMHDSLSSSAGSSRTRTAPSATSRAHSASSVARRSSPTSPVPTRTSRCSRFLTTLPSGTRWKNSRGPTPEGSMHANHEP